jgi:hypothetical protein
VGECLCSLVAKYWNQSGSLGSFWVNALLLMVTRLFGEERTSCVTCFEKALEILSSFSHYVSVHRMKVMLYINSCLDSVVGSAMVAAF